MSCHLKVQQLLVQTVKIDPQSRPVLSPIPPSPSWFEPRHGHMVIQYSDHRTIAIAYTCRIIHYEAEPPWARFSRFLGLKKKEKGSGGISAFLKKTKKTFFGLVLGSKKQK